GYKREQHRFIGAGGSGKHDDPTVIPAKNFTLSIMFVPPGQGNAAHTHEVEECFFVLQGYLDVFCEDETGKRITTRLGPWECISCPAGVIHGYQNDSLEPVYFQVMLGRGKPDTMGYADDELYKRKDAHLKAIWGGGERQLIRRNDKGKRRPEVTPKLAPGDHAGENMGKSVDVKTNMERPIGNEPMSGVAHLVCK